MLEVFAGLALVATVWFFLFGKSEKKLPKIKITLTEYEQKVDINAPVKPDMTLVTPEEPDRLQCYDPATAEHLGSVENMDKARVDEIVEKACIAQKEWAKSSWETRRAVMRAILEYYVENQEDICRVSVRDSGKTMLGAVLGEITPTCEKLRWIIAEGEKILKTEYRGGNGLLTMHKSARVEFKPLGVLGVLAPFNYPCHNLMNHIVSGLFAGNAVVSKVSEYTSWSADFYLRAVRQALQSAGYSPDLVAVVTGMGPTGAALVESRVNKIIFTGSDKIGKLVMQGAAKRLTPVILELGGKDPFIVCNDVNLNWLKDTALRGVFQNNGQNCIGIERLFVEEKAYQPFIDIVTPIIQALRQGLPLKSGGKIDLGAMTMPRQLEHIESLIQDAVSKGAKLICGGRRNESLKPGIFFEPTLITGITPDMRIATEEVFGPVMAVLKWSTEDDLYQFVNNCPYGLGSSVFTDDKTRARRIVDNVHAGMSNINDFGVNYLCQSLPFGGVKCSGFGRFAGVEGLRACCYPKSITEDRFPGVKTSIPKPWCYPTADSAPEIAEDLIGVAYGDSLYKKAISTVKLVMGLVSAKSTTSKKLD
mmetsp:Transcript_20960/g.25437  ORF Transcript_20960/g.25437 Transcript_20960/m.25437 type:complete len:591 (-) Transcript_20960:889-2661(-)